MESIAVVIPNWNGERFLGECLDSLQNQQLPPDHTIVVDNGSRDGSVDLIKQHYSHVDLIELDKNYGFAGGVNRGIEQALSWGAGYVALLNNDAVAEPGWLQALAASLYTDTGRGIAASKMLTEDGIIDSTGEYYSIWGVPFSRGRGEVDHRQYDSHDQWQVMAASGGASLYRAEMFNDVGLFDERFFAYYEDVDISLRARLKDWEVVYEPGAVVWHKVGGTSGQLGDFRLYHMYKNFFFLFFKNMPGRLFWIYSWRFGGVFDFKLLQLVVRLKLLVLLKVLGSVVWHLPGVLTDRWRIQSRRRIDTEAFDRLLYHAAPPNQPGLSKVARKLGIK